MKPRIWFVIIAVVLLALAACSSNPAESAKNNNQPVDSVEDNTQNSSPAGEDAGEGAAVQVSFAEDVLPILRSRCQQCHGGERVEGGLVVLSYGELMAGGEEGAVIIPGDAAGSLLYQLVSSGEMPKRGADLTPAQLDVLLQWINAGALDN